MTSIREVSKNALLYFLLSLVQRASSIILFPIFTIYLTKEDYGIQSITSGITQWVIIFLGFELSKAMVRFIYDRVEDTKYIHSLVGSISIVIFLINVIAATGLYFWGDVVFRYFLNEIPFRPFMLYCVFALPFMAMYNLYRVYLQATHQGKRFVIVDFSYFLINVGLNLLFVVVYDMGVLGLIVSSLISSFVFSIYSYVRFLGKLRFNFNWELLSSCLRYSLPMVPYALLGGTQTIIDSLFLNAQLGAGIAGIYYIALMIAAFFSVLKESFNSSFMPWFFGNYTKVADSYVNRIINLSYLGIGLFAIGIAWFSYEVLYLLSNNESLVEAWRYTPILINGFYIVFLGQLFNLSTLYSKSHTKYLVFSTLIGVVTNIALCLVLIKPYGAYGAAVASLASFAVMAFVQSIISYKSTTFRFEYKFLVAITIIVLTLSFVPYVSLKWMYLFIIKVSFYLVLIVIYVIYIHKKFNIINLLLTKLKSTRPDKLINKTSD